MVERWNSWSSLPSSAVARAAADSSGSGHDDWAGSPTIVQDAVRPAAADHPPLHRRQVLGLVDQDVGERVVLEPVRRCRPGPPGRCVLAVRGGHQLLHVHAALEQRGLVEVALVVGARRYVAERVAQLVEQRHVLDGQGRRVGVAEVEVGAAAPRLDQQPLLLGAEQAVARPGPAARGRAASRAPAGRPAAATRPARSRGTRGRRAGRRRTRRDRGRGRARRGPGSTVRRGARRGPGAAAGCAGPGPSAGGGRVRAPAGRG